MPNDVDYTEVEETTCQPETKVLTCPECGESKLVNISEVSLPKRVTCAECGTRYTTK